MTTFAEDDSPLQSFMFGAHISVGVTLLALLAARVVVRMRNTPPALPLEISPVERAAAKLGHIALYWLPLLVIALGWIETNSGSYTVKWFGVPMPAIFPKAMDDTQDLLATLHAWAAYTFVGLVALHVAGAIKHRIDGHDVLHRMTIREKQP